MASPNSTFTEIVTTTLREHPSEITDNVSAHNALYNRLSKKGNVRLIDGGTNIVRPLDYAENATFQRYSGFDALNVGQSDVLSAATYSWVQSAIHVIASGLEIRQNSGKNQVIDLVRARLKNAMRTAANNMSTDIYSTGALSNQMTGIGGIVTADGTGTIGGINSSTYSWWANQFREIASSNAWTKSTIVGEMNALYLNCVRGADKPDLIVSTKDFFAAYWASQQDLQRYSRGEDAKTMGPSLVFDQADVIFDVNASNFAATGETMYMLNTNYLEIVSHRDANWTTLDKKMSVNQDAEVIPVIWQGQMVCSNRSLQGRLLDAA